MGVHARAAAAGAGPRLVELPATLLAWLLLGAALQVSLALPGAPPHTLLAALPVPAADVRRPALLLPRRMLEPRVCVPRLRRSCVWVPQLRRDPLSCCWCCRVEGVGARTVHSCPCAPPTSCRCSLSCHDCPACPTCVLGPPTPPSPLLCG